MSQDFKSLRCLMFIKFQVKKMSRIHLPSCQNPSNVHLYISMYIFFKLISCVQNESGARSPPPPAPSSPLICFSLSRSDRHLRRLIGVEAVPPLVFCRGPQSPNLLMAAWRGALDAGGERLSIASAEL